MSNDESNARNQADAQMNSIRAMVGALECDFDRLEELREERQDLTEALSDARDELDAAAELVRYHHDGELYANGTYPEHATYRADLANCEEAKVALASWEEENAEELAELEEARNGCADREEAEQAISEDPLSVEVRSGWHSLGETLEASEFAILLCTGGPAVRILGELDDNNEPSRAWLEYQDWGTPWTEKPNRPGDMDTLLTYCQQFYFGE